MRKGGNNGYEVYRQLWPDVHEMSDQEGTGLVMQIMAYKFGSKIEDVEDNLNDFLELVRRYDEANGTDSVPDQVKKACIISNTLVPLKTHLQLNVAQLGNFDALRVATEDYWRSRRTFKTTSAGNTHTMKIRRMSTPSLRKGKAKETLARARRVARKEKKATQAKVTRKRQQSTRVWSVCVSKLRKVRTRSC